MLQAITKRLETQAIFQVISDILIVSKHLPPSSLINAVIDLVMTFNITSNNIERGRWGGGRLEMYLSFLFAFRSAFLDGNPFFLAEYITNFATSQLPVEIQ